MSKHFTCAECKQTKPIEKSGGTGYATLADGSKICYACCAIRDLAQLRETGRLVGYLVKQKKPFMYDYAFTNWPGSFEIDVNIRIRESFNNFGAPRVDFWFTWEGRRYWGVNVGDNQIARVRRVKA